MNNGFDSPLPMTFEEQKPDMKPDWFQWTLAACAVALVIYLLFKL